MKLGTKGTNHSTKIAATQADAEGICWPDGKNWLKMECKAGKECKVGKYSSGATEFSKISHRSGPKARRAVVNNRGL